MKHSTWQIVVWIVFEFIVLIAGKMIVSPRNTELGLSGSRDTTLPDSKAEFLNSVTANKQTVAKFHLAGSSILSHPKKKKKWSFGRARCFSWDAL